MAKLQSTEISGSATIGFCRNAQHHTHGKVKHSQTSANLIQKTDNFVMLATALLCNSTQEFIQSDSTGRRYYHSMVASLELVTALVTSTKLSYVEPGQYQDWLPFAGLPSRYLPGRSIAPTHSGHELAQCILATVSARLGRNGNEFSVAVGHVTRTAGILAQCMLTELGLNLAGSKVGDDELPREGYHALCVNLHL